MLPRTCGLEPAPSIKLRAGVRGIAPLLRHEFVKLSETQATIEFARQTERYLHPSHALGLFDKAWNGQCLTGVQLPTYDQNNC